MIAGSLVQAGASATDLLGGLGISTPRSATPVAGKNSFTMAEAKSHIEDKGYTNVTALKMDRDGVWRGMAKKDGKSGPVTVDYQGNVN